MPHKIIRNKADLAINGAAPAFSEPLHVGRPNIGDRKAFAQKVEAILDCRWLTNNGTVVREFERRVAQYLGVKHCIAMCNGTIALEIAIRALGLSGEVIVPSWTFIATAHSLHWQGIKPVFADIDRATHNLDPASVRSMITPRTSGIIGVHLWGRAAPVDALQEIADEHGLKLLFDAAHAFGCRHNGQTIGHFGACEVLSFHATKVFNTMEGGAVITEDDSLAETARLMRNFGFAGFDRVIHPGTNGKMIEVCAAIGLTNLDSLQHFIKINRQNYHEYTAAFADLGWVKLVEYDPTTNPNYQYVVAEIAPDAPVSRDKVVAALQAENILARKYFWPGCHRMKPYQDLFPHVGLHLPVTTEISERVVVLPTGTSLPTNSIETVAAVFRALQSSHL